MSTRRYTKYAWLSSDHLTVDDGQHLEELKQSISELSALIDRVVKDERCRAVALTSLETCSLYAYKGITHFE